MHNIEDYTVIQATSCSELERLVKKHMDNGWQPYGGVAVGRDAKGTFFIQTMAFLDSAQL